MCSIYDVAYDVLLDLCDCYIESGYEKILSFFFSDSSPLESLFDNVYDLDINKKMVKKIVILTFISNAYLYNLYNLERGIYPETCKSNIDLLELLDSREALRQFYDSPMEFKEIFEDSYCYLYDTYIFRYNCWETLQNKNKTRTLWRINPFTVLELTDNVLEEGFEETEEAIQTIYNLYDLAEVIVQNTFNVGDNYDLEVVKIFKKLLIERFGSDKNRLKTLCSILLGNVYENLYVYNLPVASASLIITLEFSDIEALIDVFLKDDYFADSVLSYFFSYNQMLSKEELIGNRRSFVKKGNVKRLKDFNPYFNKDEQVLKRRKNNDSDD